MNSSVDEASTHRLFKMMDWAAMYGGHAVKDVPNSFKATFKTSRDAAQYAFDLSDKYKVRVDIRGTTVFVWETEMSKAAALIESVCSGLDEGASSKWVNYASKLGGRRVSRRGSEVTFEFPDYKSAGMAADYAADLGLENNWQDEYVYVVL